MGELGALLMVLSPLAGAYSSVPSLFGLVLLIVAINGLADHYGDRSIFKNLVRGGIIILVGALIAAVIFVVAAIGVLYTLGIPTSGWSNPAVWQGIDWSNVNWSALAPYIGVAIVGLVVLWAFFIFAAMRLRESLRALSAKSGISTFATSGTILFIGAFLVIIVVGFVLMWVAMVLLAIAFFRLGSEPNRSAMANPSTFCSNCGAKLEQGWTHCPICGKGLGPSP